MISFQCDQGFSPPEERTATCARDEDNASGAWIPDPVQHTCSIRPAGLSIGAIVGIVVSALFVIITRVSFRIFVEGGQIGIYGGSGGAQGKIAV